MASNPKNVTGESKENNLNVIDLSAIGESDAAKMANNQSADANAAPKKRGRRPKAETAAKTAEINETSQTGKTVSAGDEAAPKRGRNPKSQTENVSAAKTDKPAAAKKSGESKTSSAKSSAEKPASVKAAAEKPAADAPKKRGRKPKAETETVNTQNASAPKAAGKTSAAKKSAAPKAEKSTADAPKKRGRKPKSETAAAPAPARKGGRKPKALTYDDVVSKAKKKAAAANLSLFKYGVPVTFEITGACSGDFYINVIVEENDKQIDVQPYRYDMHKVWIRADAETLAKVFDGKLDIYEALAGGDIHITGDPKQAILFINAVFAS